MTRALAWFVAAAIAAAAIAGLAPATLIDARVQALTSGRLRLVDAGGLWWNGRGALAAADGAWRIPLRWRVAVPSLLRLEPRVSIEPAEAGSPAMRAIVEIADETVRFHDVAIDVGAGAIVTALQADAIRTGGNVVLATDSLHVGKAATGTLRVEWRAARLTAAGEPLDLGTLAADLASRDEGLSGAIGNRDGEVRVSGTVVVDRRRASVAARLTPDAATSPRARELLGRIGTPSADGAVSIRLQLSR
jgi:hypothetical protein